METEQSESCEVPTTTATTDTNESETSAGEAAEQVSPEYLQRKLYFLLEQLKKMHSELPE